MSWRLRIVHTTRYTYEGTVSTGFDEARLTPVTDVGQTVLEAAVTTRPSAPQQRYWDYWGSQVTSFDLHQPHESLEVVARSVVETGPARPLPERGPGWDVLRSDSVRDAQYELLLTTPRTAPDEAMVAAARAAAGDLPPVQAAAAVLQLVHDTVAYRSGATGVQTSATEAWHLGAGVCQDLAHVAVGCLRAIGLPARYVSGYLHPAGATAKVGETVRGESHAWVEVWLGAWWPWDPTGGVPVGEQHVVVAKGRDYGDVPPLKGVYAGGGAQKLAVTVDVTRLS